MELQSGLRGGMLNILVPILSIALFACLLLWFGSLYKLCKLFSVDASIIRLAEDDPPVGFYGNKEPCHTSTRAKV